MKHLLISILILFVSSNLLSQKWQHIFGEPYRDDYSEHLIEDYDNGYLILAGYENESFWLIKTDINGGLLWEKQFEDNAHSNLFKKVRRDNEGNIYIVGWRIVELVSGWPSIIKLNECGEIIWCKEFADENYWWGWFRDFLILENGDILCLARLESQDRINQIFLYYITSDGELIWKQSYASKINYPLMGLRSGWEINFFDNNYIITGHCYYPYPTNPNHFFLRPLYIQIDSLFQEKWVLPYGVSDSIVGETYASIKISDSLYMGVGMHYFHENGESIFKSLLAFYDYYGNEGGFTVIPNESIDTNAVSNTSIDIERLNDSLFITLSSWGDGGEINPVGELVIDTSGKVHRTHQTSNTGVSAWLAKTFDNKYLIATSILETKSDWDILLYKINQNLESDTVYNGAYTYDSLCSKPIQSSTIDLSDCELVTDVHEFPSDKKINQNSQNVHIDIFPVPARNQVSITFERNVEDESIYLECYNSLGKLIHEEYIDENRNEVKLDISAWTEGLYLVVLSSNDRILGKQKFIVVK